MQLRDTGVNTRRLGSRGNEFEMVDKTGHGGSEMEDETDNDRGIIDLADYRKMEIGGSGEEGKVNFLG